MRRFLVALLLVLGAVPQQTPIRLRPVEPPEANPRIQVASEPVRASGRALEPLERTLEAILACIRSYEGGYRSVNPAGPFYGAFQFLQATWDGVARQHSPRWVGVRPDRAPPAVQNQMAAWLYQEQGLRPWPTPAKYC